MREATDVFRATVSVALPESVAMAFRQTRSAVAARSVIVWGEHCTECAFPDCYGACSFYTPRPDFHCRRFENGIEPAAADGGRISLSRIQFRRWGKLEGRGPISLHAARRGDRLEQASALADVVLSGPTPAAVDEKIKWRLDQAKRGLGRKGEPVGVDDVYLIEILSEGAEPWTFTLSIMNAGKDHAGLFQAPLKVQPGYNRFIHSARQIAAFVDLSQEITVQVEPLAEGAPVILVGFNDFARLKQPLQGTGQAETTPDRAQPKFKCVVWDLDNTLWNGVLVEDGVDGVVLNPQAAAAVRELDHRGVINSIASKNDAALAREALERFGLLEFFVFPKISWGPKSEAIKAIIAEMDVSADTFAFIDDQAFERGEIRQLLPEVAVFSEQDLDGLLLHDRFDVPVTPESAQRRRMYQTEERRQAAREGSALDYVEFLRTCDIRLEVAPLQPQSLARAYELSQRTNQLNVSGERYAQSQLQALMSERPEDVFVISCTDKFGDYGAIGLCVLRADRPAVEAFFMSCRVQRKRVEHAFFQHLAQILSQRGADRLEVAFKATAKNGAAVQMFKDLGFDFQPAGEGEGRFLRCLSAPFADSDVVSVSMAADPDKVKAVA